MCHIHLAMATEPPQLTNYEVSINVINLQMLSISHMTALLQYLNDNFWNLGI